MYFILVVYSYTSSLKSGASDHEGAVADDEAYGFSLDYSLTVHYIPSLYSKTVACC